MIHSLQLIGADLLNLNKQTEPKVSKIFCPENQVKVGSTFIVNVDTDFGAKIELFKISRPDDENLELKVDF